MGRRGEHLAAIPGPVPALNQAFGGCRFAQRCPAHAAECDAAPPPLVQETPGHAVRCVRLVQIDAARAAGKGEPLPEVHVVEPPEAAAVAPAPAFAASAPGSGLLSVTDLKVHFPIRKGVLRRTAGWVKAVDGVSLSLDTGKTLALVGESGCGKTTTGKALLRLLDGVATISGQASLQGQDLLRAGGRSLKRLRRDIQIIFKDPYASLNPRMRVGEILDEGLASLRPDLDAASRQAAMLRLLDQVGLRADARDRYPHEFSGGQRQRIAIARALAVEPKLMVCDEPTSALDVSVQAQILNLLHALQRDMGIAYLFITHNFGVVEYLADDIAVMQGGRIVETGPAERVLTRPDHAYTRQLLDAVPRFTVESA